MEQITAKSAFCINRMFGTGPGNLGYVGLGICQFVHVQDRLLSAFIGEDEISITARKMISHTLLLGIIRAAQAGERYESPPKK